MTHGFGVGHIIEHPIGNDLRGDLIKLVQKLNVAGTRPGVLPFLPDLAEHREAVERLWEQYNREQQRGP